MGFQVRVLKTFEGVPSSLANGHVQHRRKIMTRRWLQGYLAHKKHPPPLGPPQVPRHIATVGSYGEGVSYERGTPVTGIMSEVPLSLVPLSPRQSLIGGRQKSISPQGSGSQKPNPPHEAVLNRFAPFNTLAWHWRWLAAPRSPAQYRCTSLIRNSPPPGPHSRCMPRILWWF